MHPAARHPMALPYPVLKSSSFLLFLAVTPPPKCLFLSLCTEAGARRNETNGIHKTWFSQGVKLPFLTLQRARAGTIPAVDARPA
jgi:hypothetical protein